MKILTNKEEQRLNKKIDILKEAVDLLHEISQPGKVRNTLDELALLGVINASVTDLRASI